MSAAKGCGQKRTSAWRKGYSADQTIQRVRPRESFAYLGNPHKGTTTFQRFNGDKPFPLSGRVAGSLIGVSGPQAWRWAPDRRERAIMAEIVPLDDKEG